MWRCPNLPCALGLSDGVAQGTEAVEEPVVRSRHLDDIAGFIGEDNQALVVQNKAVLILPSWAAPIRSQGSQGRAGVMPD